MIARWVVFEILIGLAPASAATLSKSYTFSAGQTASASAVNGNFDQLFSEINSKETRITSLESSSWTKSGTDLNYSSGNVGVGTVPNATLDLLANATAMNMTFGSWVADARYNAITMNGLYATSGAYNVLTSNFDQNLYLNRPSGHDIRFRENNVDQVTIQTTTGYLGIGNTNPGHLLEVGANGDGSSAIANSWLTFSDLRLKTLEGSVKGACEMVDRLHAYYYRWKEGSDRRRQIGLVAQEVETVLPELVYEDSRGIKSVDYPKLGAVLVEAIRELRRENESLAAELRRKNESHAKELQHRKEALFSLEERVRALEARHPLPDSR